LLVAESPPSQPFLNPKVANGFARSPINYSAISHLSNPPSLLNRPISLRISPSRAPYGFSLPPNCSHALTNVSQTPDTALSRRSKAVLTTEPESQSTDGN